jgi:hypothetical protein
VLFRSLNETLLERIANRFKKTTQDLFEKTNEANLDRMRDKIDTLRKEISDLEIRRRNTENETFKKSTSTQIDSKRSQVRTLQKSIKMAQVSKETKKQQ